MYSSPQTEFARLRQQAGLTIRELETSLGYAQRTLQRYETGETSPRFPVLEKLQQIAGARIREVSATHGFRFIDLFAGIGGMRRGFESIGGRCVFTSEWNKYARETYCANFPNATHDVAGDITKIEPDEIPQHNVLLAGFPCQPFSIAGVSKKNALNRPHGFRCEAQGTLFFDVARIIEHHQPEAFLLENVKNLVNHNQGNTFDVIHRTLTEELGYQVHWKIIDARVFVPQHRERIFIVGFREKNQFTLDNLKLLGPTAAPNLSSILHPQDGSEVVDDRYTIGTKGKVLDKYTLSDHLWKYLQAYARKHQLKGNGFGFGLCTPDDVARTLSARYYKDGSEILIKQARRSPRRLTPRECARLMGFEKPGEACFKIPVSDTQAYKQFGNSVVVPVVEAVARHMQPWIQDCLAHAEQDMRATGTHG